MRLERRKLRLTPVCREYAEGRVRHKRRQSPNPLLWMMTVHKDYSMKSDVVLIVTGGMKPPHPVASQNARATVDTLDALGAR